MGLAALCGVAGMLTILGCNGGGGSDDPRIEAGVSPLAPERFSAPTTFDAGESPGWIAAADFNGDGLVDLVVAEGGIFANPPN